MRPGLAERSDARPLVEFDPERSEGSGLKIEIPRPTTSE